MADAYHFRATLIRVVDGDTVWVTVDQGFRTRRDIDLRIDGINAPEMSTDAGKAAKAAAIAWFAARTIEVTTYQDPGSYDRYTATVTDAHTGEDFAKYMLDNGFAVPYKYPWG